MISVVGVFDRFAPAQSAKNELLVAGFAWNQVQLTPDHEVGHSTKTSAPRPDDPMLKDDPSPGLGKYLRGLFGVGDQSSHGDLYGEAVKHGFYVLIADVDSDQQRQRAEEIMRQHAPFELKCRES
jgi:hypothetical protein